MKILITIVFFCLSLNIVSAKNNLIRVAVLKDFPPLYMLDKDQKPIGFAIDTIQVVSKQAGLEIEYIPVENWAKAMELVRTGKADLIPGIGISQARKKEFMFSEKIETIPVSYFVRSSNYSIHGLEDLKDKNIGVIAESAAYTRLRKNKQLSIITFGNIDQGIMHLLSGDIDSFIFPKPVLLKKIRSLRLDDKIKTVGIPLMELKRGFLFNKKNKDLFNKINPFIQAYIHSKDYMNSYFKWYGKPRAFWNVTRVLWATGIILFFSILGMIIWRSFSISRINLRLKNEKSRLKVAAHVAGDILYEWNVENDELKWLGDIDEALGYEKGEIAENINAWIKLIHPEDAKKMKLAVQHHKFSTEPISYEYKVKNKDGSWRIWFDCASPILDKEGKPIKWIGRCTDITELVYTQKELKEREQYLMAIKNNAGDAIYVCDLEANIVDVNEAACKMLGYTKEELLSKKVPQMDMMVDSVEDVVNGWKEMVIGKTYAIEGKHIHKNGEHIPVEINASVVELKGKRHIMGLARDQRERIKAEEELKATQEQLFQSQKMESIGHLAGGIAHDFNNILAGIIGLTELSIMNSSRNSELRKNLSKVLNAADRAKNLVAQILAFSRQSSEVTSPLYLKSIIKEVSELLRASLPSSIEIKTELITDKKPVVANATKVHEVIMNLCTNAAHAMGEKGLLEIIQEERKIVNSINTDSGIIEPGHYSVITVRDNGHGIAPDNIKKIFEPYYTTKPIGEGTGLGLAVAFGIIKSYEGSIIVTSEEGKGAEFQVFFPQVSSVETQEVTPNDEIPEGNERVLFVDDEIELCELYQKMLSNMGYAVTAFTDSKQALGSFRNAPDLYDIVITDQTMPKMTGYEMAKEMVRIRSDIPIIICTGYSKDLNHKVAKDLGIKAYCEKPLRMKDLANKIREALK